MVSKPSLLILGTYHMGNRGNRDVYQVQNAVKASRNGWIRSSNVLNF